MVAWPEAREPAAERLVAELQALPPGSLVPRDWILGRLTEPVPARDAPLPVTAPTIDRTVHDVATLFGKRPSTVRAWIERGDFPGSYKLHGKEWRVPPAALDAFQQAQRARSASPHAGAKADLAAWRSARRSPRGSHHALPNGKAAEPGSRPGITTREWRAHEKVVDDRSGRRAARAVGGLRPAADG